MPANVTVILPTFNRPHTIAYSIESVLRQSYPSLELHVIGDGCDAETERVALSSGDARVRFHRFPKGRGFGYGNRNRVLRETRSEFIAYATDDDLWFPDHLERGLSIIGRDNVMLAAFRSYRVLPPDVVDPHFFAYDWRLPVLSAFLRHWFMGAVSCIHRRELFDHIGYWNAALRRFGDRDFYNRARRGVPTRYVNEATVLRFYAQDWDWHYPHTAEPPQRRYLAKVQDSAWRQQFRRLAQPGQRSPGVRYRQLRDFGRFGVRSGLKFVRFWYERARARPGGHE